MIKFHWIQRYQSPIVKVLNKFRSIGLDDIQAQFVKESATVQIRQINFIVNLNNWNRIGGVMVSVLASSAVYRGFESRSGQTKVFKIGICCFSAKHAVLRMKSKDWLARNQDNVFE